MVDTIVCSLCSGVGELAYNPQEDSDDVETCTCHICGGLGHIPNHGQTQRAQPTKNLVQIRNKIVEGFLKKQKHQNLNRAEDV